MAFTRYLNQGQAQRPDVPGSGASTLTTLAMIVIVVAALYFGRDIFVPLALAMLMSFALAPIVRWLRRLHVPSVPAVLTAVCLAFLFIIAFGSIVAWQAADLAQRLPTYRLNIEAKIDGFFAEPPGGRLFERATDLLRDLGRRIEQQEGAQQPDTTPGGLLGEEPKPLAVELHQPAPTSMQIIRTILGPLISPLATAGIVIVFVIFMLLKREDLRDRFIRLAGSRDLPRTTQALDDAARRVGRYLLMQLVVNTTYAIPIGIGLWLIGIPNAALWGMLCGLLRFAPYVGPIIAAFFPLALAIAVDPGWTTFVLAAALFVVVELISNNLVEPWLYGASTGLSPIAIIAAAVFWTWLWGPVGLLLATPLTVCLVVLGRHVPQLGFLDVLLGNEPVLAPSELLYQRLLVGDPDEATERAETYLRKNALASFYDEVAIPALALAEQDRVDGRLSEEQRTRVGEGAMILVDNLSEWEENGAAAESAERDADEDAEDAGEPAAPDLSALQGSSILCAGARGNLDDAAAAMLAQILERQGAEVRLVPHEELQTARLRAADLGKPSVVVLSYMNADSMAHARMLTRRLRRRLPEATMVAGFWSLDSAAADRNDPLEATRADRVAASLSEAVEITSKVCASDQAEERSPIVAVQ